MTRQLSNLQRFRKENRRIDYYPTNEAVAAIERLGLMFPELSTRELVDMLVTQGIKAFPETSQVGMTLV